MREVPDSSSLATNDPERLDRVDKFGQRDAEEEVMEAETQLQEEQREAEVLQNVQGEDVTMDGLDGDDKSKPSLFIGTSGGGNSGTTSMTVTPPTPFQFAFPAPTNANFPARTPPVPGRRRSGAPSSIPNFPTATAPHRGSNGSSPSSLSPVRSPFRAPLSPNTPPTASRSGILNLPAPAISTSSGQSPWAMLAESSGAPTPSLHGPGRSSPHLGGPFEKLNLGSSWSGGNLWAEGAPAPAAGLSARRASADQSAGLGVGPVTRSAGSPSMSAETLARYRAMAGKASASGSKGKSTSDESSPSGSSTPAGSTHASPSKAPLPPALASRRGSVPKNILDSLSPPSQHTTKSPSPLASEASSESSPAPPKLQPISASDVGAMMAKMSTLVLDVRPPSSFQSSHIPSAHSLPIPSTLLRRPAFNLNRLVGMLAPPSMEAVSKWKSMDDIILLDLDSTTAPEGSILEGLAGKFEREGFGGHLWFIRGGQTAAKGAGVAMKTEALDDASTDVSAGPSTPSLSTSAPAGKLMGARLGKLAFQSGESPFVLAKAGSTGSQGQSRQPSGSSSDFQGPPTPGSLRADPFSGAMGGLSTRSSGASSLRGLKNGSELSLISNISSTSSKKSSYQAANPFFDNIRQNLELAHGGITERIPLNLPQEVKRRAHELPAWLADLVDMGEDEGAERLALQFYQVELGEQKRLQAVMDWHSKASGNVVKGEKTEWDEQMKRDGEEIDRLGIGEDGNPAYFPFSITAGVERGTKNRYKNIWPYDFSRVKLDAPTNGDTDYINASFVQPRGTSRRYIATQGPLDATYCDFWTLIWEQDVRVIVMLTKQYEGGQLKCGNYWEDPKYGCFRLELVEQSGGEDKAHQPTTGFDFGVAAATPVVEGPEIPENIKRVFTLSNEKSKMPPRKIIQLQCTAWPDFDVPDTPDVLLSLIRDTDAAMLEARPTETDRADCPPVLVHCSAGVGRTGSFIIVDAMLDGLRREHKHVKHMAIEDGEKVPRIPTIPGVEYPNARTERKSGSGSPSLSDSRKSGSPDNLSGSENDLLGGGSRTSGQSSGLASAGPAFGSGGGHSAAGSRGTSKSVTFVDPNPISRSSASPAPATIPAPLGIRKSSLSPALQSHAVFSTSPAAMMHPAPGQATRDVPSFFDTEGKSASGSSGRASKNGSSGGTATEVDDSMDVDAPSEAIPIPAPAHHLGFDSTLKSPTLDDGKFTKYRSGASTISSDAGSLRGSSAGRRPSLGSVFTSSERMSENAMHRELPEPTPITKSTDRHRTPSPISAMDNPIVAVLEGMRVQRMSLVQSLRQYVFVHRAIIHNYLAMLDEESDRDTSKESTAESDGASYSRSSTGITGRSTSGEADEPHKRRASPTELSQDRTPPKSPGQPLDAVSLARRGSVKRMRGAERIEVPMGEGSDAGSSGSANIIGMKRRSSKQ